MGESSGEFGNVPGIVVAVEGRYSGDGSRCGVGGFTFSMVVDGMSFGGGTGRGEGRGGGMEVPAVRDSEREASSFGSLKRDVGVRFGVGDVPSSGSISLTNSGQGGTKSYMYYTAIVQCADTKTNLEYECTAKNERQKLKMKMLWKFNV